MKRATTVWLLIPMFYFSPLVAADAEAMSLHREVDTRAAALEAKVIAWRRDIHAHPELSNREFRTAKLVADHLRGLGLEVSEGVAHTGVVGLLKGKGGKGGKGDGPVVALRADMDGLPVTEDTGLSFASKVRTTFNGQDVGVMHACGHDTHVAMLMGVAEILTGMRDLLPGAVKFIFQPAEEGAPKGEEGGAELMVAEGVLQDPPVDAVFGLHISTRAHAHTINYRSGGLMASSDRLHITVHGKQTHGASPWNGVDPIVTAAQIVLALQTIPSRQMRATKAASIVTIGSIHGGVRSNIIPDKVEMVGTIRALDPEMRRDLHERIERTVTHVAASAGARAEVEIERGYSITYNDPSLTERVQPTLRRVAGADRVHIMDAVTGAEDFSFFAEKVPGFYFFLGGVPPDVPLDEAPPHHTPTFAIDEATMKLGMRALANLAVDYMLKSP